MLIKSILEDGDGAALTVGPDDSVHDVAVLLAERKIGAAVVTGAAGEIIGIVSERDIVRAFAAHEAGLSAQTVKALMTSPVITCAPDTKIADVAQMMDAHHIRHLPVVDRDALVGVVSIRDIVTRRLLTLETDVEVLRGQLMDRPGLSQTPH